MLLGTVSAVDPNNGITILIDGEDEATTKKYNYLSSYSPTAGDRVLVEEVGDSYVIIGRVTDDYSTAGHAHYADTAGTASTAETANTANTATSASSASTATTAGSATKATQDESGNNIKATYAADLTVSNGKIQLKNKNNGTIGTNATLANVESVYNQKSTSNPIYFGLLNNDLYFSTSKSYNWKKVTGTNA